MKQTKEDRAEAYRKDMCILDGDQVRFDSIDIGSARYVAFIAGTEWQLQQLGHPDPPGEQGTDGTITIKEVMKEKAIEAFNEAMIYFESPDCPTAEEALKHFIACLDQEPDSGCSEKPNN